MTTLERAEATLVEYFKQIGEAIKENSLCIDFFDISNVNEHASLKGRRHTKGEMQNYIEYKVNTQVKQFKPKDRFLIHSVYL